MQYNNRIMGQGKNRKHQTLKFHSIIHTQSSNFTRKDIFDIRSIYNCSNALKCIDLKQRFNAIILSMYVRVPTHPTCA